MKITCFIVAVLLTPLLHFAQPVINPAQITTYLTCEALVASTENFDPGTMGANKIWDFSHLELLPEGTCDIVPYAYIDSSNPTNATFCTDFTGHSNESYICYHHTAEKIEMTGQWFSDIGTIDYSANPKTYLTFPYTYKTVINDSYRINGSQREQNFTSTYDAYGTLVMPYGTYRNVIRQKIEQDGKTDYIWFNADPFFPIVQTAMDDHTIGVMMPSEALDFDTFQPNIALTVSPNPANDSINVHFDQQVDTEICIYDLSGKLVAHQTVSGQSAEINLQSCESGIYMVSATVNNRTALQKIIKN